jgi:hypothetical protein
MKHALYAQYTIIIVVVFYITNHMCHIITQGILIKFYMGVLSHAVCKMASEVS